MYIYNHYWNKKKTTKTHFQFYRPFNHVLGVVMKLISRSYSTKSKMQTVSDQGIYHKSFFSVTKGLYPGGDCWGYHPGTLPSLSIHCNFLWKFVSIDEIYGSPFFGRKWHESNPEVAEIDVIMTTMTSQISSLTVVYSIVYAGRSTKTSKLRVTGLCAGNSPGPVNSPHKGPVTWKMFPFDDVIMSAFCDRSW